MDDSDPELARAIAASLGEASPPPPAATAAATAEGADAGPAVDQDDEAYARALQASMDETGLPGAARSAQRSTGLPASFAVPAGLGESRPFTPREPAMQEAIMASTRVQNREDDDLRRALAASLAEGSDGDDAPAAAPTSVEGDDDLAAAIAASMGEPPAARERPGEFVPSAMDSFASIAGLPAAAGLRADLGAAGGLDATTLAATMGLTVDEVPASLAALGLPPAIGREAGGAGAVGMSEDEQISAAVMASTEDDMERAIMMSLAAGGGHDAGSGTDAVEPADAPSEFEPMPPVARLGGADAVTGDRAGTTQADADEADDIAQAIAVSMGQPIDRGRRPVGAAAVHRQPQPETPPGVRAARLERQEQDEAYQAGLMEDEARRIMEETAAQADADAKAEEARQQESAQARAREELETLEAELSSPPEPAAGSEGSTEIMLELPTGERTTRRFGELADANTTARAGRRHSTA